MAETPPIRKFMFDHSFDGGPNRVSERPRSPVTLKPEQVDALKKEAYNAGFAAGEKAGVDQHAQGLADILAQIDRKLTGLVQNAETAHAEQTTQMHGAILAIARKILPEFTASQGLQEIQAMLSKVIGEMAHEPRLVVRVNESEFDALNARISEITARKAFAGKVVVLADPEIAAGDCRAEWADGGMERNVEATWQSVEQVVAPETAGNSH